MKHFVHWLEGAGVVVLGSVPAILASPAFDHFIMHHPLWAAYVPVAAGVAHWLYQQVKKPA